MEGNIDEDMKKKEKTIQEIKLLEGGVQNKDENQVSEEKEREKKYIFFDTEATGLSVYEDQITEIAFKCGNLIFHHLIQVEKTVSEKARKITKITNEKLKNSKKACEIFELLTKWFEKMALTFTNHEFVLVAYNGFSYDIPLLFNEFKRNGLNLQIEFEKYRITYLLDPLIWFRNFAPKNMLLGKNDGTRSLKQEDVYRVLFQEFLEGAHSALDDTKALEKICKKTSHFSDEPLWGNLVCMKTTKEVLSFCYRKRKFTECAGKRSVEDALDKKKIPKVNILTFIKRKRKREDE